MREGERKKREREGKGVRGRVLEGSLFPKHRVILKISRAAN